ncbi:MAG: kelch repeat-containing protein, partial [Planctomycetota bacterium]
MRHAFLTRSLTLIAPLAALLAAAGCVDDDKDEPAEFVVIGATPVPQDTNVSTSSAIVLRFNQAVDPGSYTGTNQIILVDQNNSTVAAALTPAPGGAASEFVTITPAVALAPNTTYGVAVREMTATPSGQTITAPWSMTFSTGTFVATIPGFPPFATPNPAPVSAGLPGQFTLSGRMSQARSRHQASTLQGDRVAVFGGIAPVPGGTVLSSTEIYSASTGTWSVSTANGGRGMTYSRYGHTATLLANGKVLITGGTDNNAIWDTAELYDPLTDSFGVTPAKMVLPRAHHTATKIGNGNVVLAGGFAYNVAGNATGGSSAFAVITDSIEVYDVPSGTFLNSSQTLTREKMYHTATRMPDGDIVFAGGYILPYSAAFWCPTTGMADRYSPNLAQGSGEVASLLPIGNMKTPRMNHTATLYTTGQ